MVVKWIITITYGYTPAHFSAGMSYTKHYIVGLFIIVRVSYCFVSMYSYVLGYTDLLVK